MWNGLDENDIILESENRTKDRANGARSHSRVRRKTRGLLGDQTKKSGVHAVVFKTRSVVWIAATRRA